MKETEINWFPLPSPTNEPKRCLGPDISSIWVWKRKIGFRLVEKALKRYIASDKGFRLWEKSWILVTTCLMNRLGNNASKFLK